MHVLIIEDEPLLAMDIQCFLEELGADTFDFAETETEAVAFAQSHTPDLITADVSLREGTGPAAVTTIRGDLGQVPVVFVTGQPESSLPGDAMTHVVKKPILWLELAEAVCQHGMPPVS